MDRALELGINFFDTANVYGAAGPADRRDHRALADPGRAPSGADGHRDEGLRGSRRGVAVDDAPGWLTAPQRAPLRDSSVPSSEPSTLSGVVTSPSRLYRAWLPNVSAEHAPPRERGRPANEAAPNDIMASWACRRRRASAHGKPSAFGAEGGYAPHSRRDSPCVWGSSLRCRPRWPYGPRPTTSLRRSRRSAVRHTVRRRAQLRADGRVSRERHRWHVR